MHSDYLYKRRGVLRRLLWRGRWFGFGRRFAPVQGADLGSLLDAYGVLRLRPLPYAATPRREVIPFVALRFFELNPSLCLTLPLRLELG